MKNSEENGFKLADNVIGFIATCKVDSTYIDSVYVRVREVLEKHEKISLYLEFTSESIIHSEAILRDLTHEIKLLNRFKKVALVSDKPLIKALGMLKKNFLNAEVRAFSNTCRMDALSWVSLA